MKKGITMFLIAVCCLSAGCGSAADAEKENAGQAEAGQENAGQEDTEQENAEQENAEQEDEWGLTLRAESVSAEGCTIVFVQHGGAPTGELSSGSWYRIEKKEGDEWVEQPYAPGIGDEVGWTGEGWTIPDEGSVSFEENWSFLYGELPPGNYRIVKEIMDWREAGDFDEKWYYAEFSL